jgi:hypothetical protein
MDREGNCGCGGHGHHHEEQTSERQEGQGENCGCGGHEHHGHHEQGMNREGCHGGCNCGCHQPHRGMRFNRHFVSREEVITRLEEYLKQLQAEAKGVEERIAEMKKEKESQ